MQCSWRHKLKHVEKVDLDRRGVATIIGKAFHSAIEARVQGLEPDREKIREEVVEELARVTDEAEKAKFDVDANVERAIVMSVEALEFLNAKFPGWKLWKAEENLYEAIALDVAQHDNVSFKGFIDLIIEVPDKKHGTAFWVLDWKTASRPWGKDKLMDPKVTYQLVLYKNFWAAKHGVPLARIKCGYIVAVKSAKPGKLCNLIPVSVGEVTSKRTLTVLNNFVHSVKKGMALKNKSDKNCKWCEYKGTKFCP